jgi:hypothetical protein
MANVIDITNKFSMERPKIVLGDKTYEVDNSVSATFKYEENVRKGTEEGFNTAFEIALGKEAVKELDISKLSVENFKVLSIAVSAAMQNETYEVADKRFQNKKK